MKGTVELLSIVPDRSGPADLVDEIEVVAGKGIVGDYHYKNFVAKPETHRADREITLIEIEAIEAVNRDYKIKMDTDESRRNVVVKGYAVNHLVGKEFNVGEVVLRGIRLCEPCSHLEYLSRKGIEDALTHRGGLRAAVVTNGKIRLGDSIFIKE